MRSQGFLSVSFNVLLKDMKKLGYDVSATGLESVSEFPLGSLLPGGGSPKKVPTAAPSASRSQQQKPSSSSTEIAETVAEVHASGQHLDRRGSGDEDVVWSPEASQVGEYEEETEVVVAKKPSISGHKKMARIVESQEESLVEPL